MKRAAKQILIFNNRKILVLIASSVTEAAKFSGLHRGNISLACRGKSNRISDGNYYFRYIDDNVEVDLNDIGTLKLSEYDALCEVDRPVYRTMQMNRKNWKYNTKSKNNEN